MFPSRRPDGDSEDDKIEDPTIFRSAAIGVPLPPVPSIVGGGGTTRLRSTGSAKSKSSSAAETSSVGSFWGLGGGGASSPAGVPEPKKFPAAPTPVLRQQSSISTVPAAVPTYSSDGTTLQVSSSTSTEQAAGDGGSASATSAGAARISVSWNVTSATLRPIPPYFPVERTHAVLKSNPQDVECDASASADDDDNAAADNDPASAAADRIVKCLDELSISAVYDDERGVCLATTGDRCRFYIRFFRIEGELNDEDRDRDQDQDDALLGAGDGDEDEEGRDNGAVDRRDDGSILLELQRRRGSCLSFRSAAREIFRVVKGVDEPSSSSSSSSASRAGSSCPAGVEVRPPCCPPSFSSPAFVREESAKADRRHRAAAAQLGQGQDDEEEEDQEEEEECPAAACLSNVVRLLTEEDGRIDAKVLAFESLRCVSDMGNNNERYACEAARALTTCTKSGGNGLRCREALVRLLARSAASMAQAQQQQDSANSSDEEDELSDDLEALYVDEMRGLALTALANSLEATTSMTEEEEEEDDEGSKSIPLDELLPSLLEDVLRLYSCRRPHDAAEAARCLKALLQSSSSSLSAETRGRLVNLGAGKRIRSLLEEEGEEANANVRRYPRLAAELDAVLEALAQ